MSNSQKIKIAENSVQSTLVFPVWGRATCTKYYPKLCNDTSAVALLEHLDYPFEGPQFTKYVSVLYGVRQKILIHGILRYIKKHPHATIINLGCGLDTSFNMADNGKINWVNIDLPDVIEFRNQLLPDSAREKNLAYDILDTRWLDEINFDKSNGLYAIAGGVIYYFQESDVKQLFVAMAEKFKGGAIYFDCENELGVKMSNRMVKKSGNTGSPLLFSVNNAAKKFTPWSKHFSYIREEKSFPKAVIKNMPWPHKLIAFMSNFGMMKFVEIGFGE